MLCTSCIALLCPAVVSLKGKKYLSFSSSEVLRLHKSLRMLGENEKCSEKMSLSHNGKITYTKSNRLRHDSFYRNIKVY